MQKVGEVEELMMVIMVGISRDALQLNSGRHDMP